MKLLVAILALLAAAIGGVKYHLARQAEHYASAANLLVLPIGTLEWAEVFADWSGAAGLKSLTVTLRESQRVLRFDTATVHSDFSTLAGLNRRLGRPALPHALRVEFDSTEWLNWGGIAPWLPARGSNVSGNPLESAACAGVSTFGDRQLRRMGYPPVPSRINLSYAYDSAVGVLVVGLEFMTRRVSTVSLEVTLNIDAWPKSLADIEWQGLTVSNIRLVLDDQEFNALRNQFCNGLRGMFAEPFLLAHTSAVQEQLGIEDPTVMALYSRWSSGGSDLLLNWRAPAPVRLQQLLDGSTAAALDQMFDVTLSLQGGVSLPLDGLARAIQGEGTGVVVGNATPVDELRGTTEVPVDQLSTLVGQNISIALVVGQRYRGRLVAAEGGHVMMEIGDGSEATLLPLRLSDIATVWATIESTTIE